MKQKNSGGKGILATIAVVFITIAIVFFIVNSGALFFSGTHDSGNSTGTVQEKIYSFRNHDYLSNHYQKHGVEMGYNSEEDYLQGANDVINNPDALYKTEKEDGDGVYYIPQTGEIVFLSGDGYIRTFFITDDKAYFDRQ